MRQVALSVPQDWVHLDLSPKGVRKADDLVDRLVTSSGQAPDVNGRIRQLLHAAVRTARDQNAVIAALWAAPHASHMILAASLAVAVRPSGPLATPSVGGGNRAGDAAEQIMERLGGRDDVTELEQVELPAGAAVREVRKTVASEDRRATLAVQYYVPVVGQPVVVVATFTSPLTDLADRFVKLFDQLALTLHIDPEFPESEAPDRIRTS